MADRLEIAKQFMRETLAERDDIIGVMVQGSVPRGEETEISDIDIALYAKELTGEEIQNRWEDDIFIECHWGESTKGLNSLEEAMAHPVSATHMNDAIIIHDPTQHFTKLQRQVRNVYMEPKWLHMRLNLGLEYFRKFLAILQESIANADFHGIRDSVLWIASLSGSIPLFIEGITPSSTRMLAQLSRVAPGIRRIICELVYSLDITPEMTTALIDTCVAFVDLMGPTYADGAGRYMIRKVRSMAGHGEMCQAAFVMMHVNDKIIDENSKKAETLLRDWFERIGWVGNDALEMKITLAETLLHELETMVASQMAQD